MKSLTYAALITLATVAVAAAQPTSIAPSNSQAATAPSTSSGQQPAQMSGAGGAVTKAEKRAQQDQAEDRITAQLNRQQLANATSAATTPIRSVPQTATRPSDCAPGQSDCNPATSAQ